MDQCSMPPRIATVWQMASILAAQNATLANPPHVGQNWVQKFINHHNNLKSQYNHRYGYQQIKCKDPMLI